MDPEVLETPAEEAGAFDNAFSEAAADPGEDAGPATTEEKDEPETGGKEGTPAPGESAGEGEEGAHKGEDGGQGEGAPEPEDPAKLKKMIADNQAWATRVAQENARLRAELETAKTGKPAGGKEAEGTPNAPAPEGEDLPEDVKEYLQDYPEAQKAIDLFVDRKVKALLGGLDVKEMGTAVMRLHHDLAQVNFENVVLGGYVDPEKGDFVDGHPDARKILRSKEYGDFVADRRKQDQTYGITNDPRQAIKILTDFKESRLREATGRKDEANKEKSKKVIELAQGALSPGMGRTGGGARKAEDFDSAFDEAASQ